MYKKVLALAPHTDDVELGCGGFLSKLTKEKVIVDVISFSEAQPLSVGDPVQEFRDAMKIIGIDGGASKVSGAIIERVNEDTFDISGNIIELNYKDHASFDHSFKPIDLSEQLNGVPILQNEKTQGQAYIETLLNVIKQLGGYTDSFISIAIP